MCGEMLTNMFLFEPLQAQNLINIGRSDFHELVVGGNYQQILSYRTMKKKSQDKSTVKCARIQNVIKIYRYKDFITNLSEKNIIVEFLTRHTNFSILIICENAKI